MGPKSKFEHIYATPAGLTAADQVLPHPELFRQLRLAQASPLPERIQFFQKVRVLLGVYRASHPAAVACATAQDQSEREIWENAIICRLSVQLGKRALDVLAKVGNQAQRGLGRAVGPAAVDRSG